MAVALMIALQVSLPADLTPIVLLIGTLLHGNNGDDPVPLLATGATSGSPT